MDSISVKIEAPVVVNPEIVSKSISIKLKLLFEKIYGSVPNNEINIHEIPTAANPWIVVSCFEGIIFFLTILSQKSLCN